MITTITETLKAEPTTIREAMNSWRKLTDHVSDVESTIEKHKDKIKELRTYILQNLDIPAGEKKSETITIPDIGTVYKKNVVGIRVTDWKAFQSYLSRNDMEAVIRHQCNLQPSEELYDMVMDGTIPNPRSAEFTSFEKLTLRRIG